MNSKGRSLLRLYMHRLTLFCILSLLMLALLPVPSTRSHFSRSSPAVFAQDVPEELMLWPMSADGTRNDGYLYVSEAFGPREAKPGKEPMENWFHVGLDMCSERPALKDKPIYNPFNEDVEIYDKNGTSPNKWFAIKNLNENHEVKYVAFFHVNTDNIVVGNVYGPGQDFPVTIDQNTDGGKHNPHLHFEVYTDRFSTDERNKLTKNPVRWLDYDYDACADNEEWYRDNETWYAFGSEYVPDEGTDLRYLEVTVKQHHDCLNHDKVIVNFGPLSNEDYLIGENVIGLNERKSSILDDLNGTTKEYYNNRYHKGHQIIAEHWGSACDRDPNNKYTVKYRFYFKPGTTFDDNNYFSITLKYVYDYTWASVARVKIPVCVGCYPPDNAPLPPTLLTAVTRDEGVLLNWTSSRSNNDPRLGFGYLVYRRDISSPDIRSAIPIAYVTRGSPTPYQYLDPVTNKVYGTKPGASYYYSIASVAQEVGEGCNGPFVTPGCQPPPGQTCFEACPVNEIKAQMPEIFPKLSGSDTTPGDRFGWSVAISGDTAVVGANGDDDACPNNPGCNSGSAYIFQRSGTSWSQQTKLTANDAAANDGFGWRVAISGDTVVVGAIGNNGNRGAAYIFQRSGTSWSQQAKLTASDAEAGDQLGYSVAISGDTVVAGARGDDDGGNNAGATYIFQRSGTSWSQQAKLTASDAEAQDWFGTSVAVSGDTAVVGAPFKDDAGDQSGSTYIFKKPDTGWTLTNQEDAKLTASDAAFYDHFGISVSINEDEGTVVVGANFDDDNGTSSGIAYIFRGSGTSWSQQAKLTAFDAAAFDDFGYSVAISGNTVVVGAPGDDNTDTYSGSVYIFRGPSWNQRAKLVGNDSFGLSVAISGETAIFGAPANFTRAKGSASVVAEITTAIDLLSFTAHPGADHLALAWETGTEVDNAGFNLHRATAVDGPYTKLNDALIPAEGDPESGASYTYTDTDVVKGVTYYYKLEDVDIHGVSAFHGPVSATPGRIHLVYLPLVLR